MGGSAFFPCLRSIWNIRILLYAPYRLVYLCFSQHSLVSAAGAKSSQDRNCLRATRRSSVFLPLPPTRHSSVMRVFGKCSTPRLSCRIARLSAISADWSSGSGRIGAVFSVVDVQREREIGRTYDRKAKEGLLLMQLRGE